MQSSNRGRTFVRNERETLAERVVAFMRHKHPVKTAEHIAAETGLNLYTIRKLADRLSAPSLVVFHRLSQTYGIEFLWFVLELECLNPIKRDESQRVLQARFATLMDEFKNLRG